MSLDQKENLLKEGVAATSLDANAHRRMTHINIAERNAPVILEPANSDFESLINFDSSDESSPVSTESNDAQPTAIEPNNAHTISEMSGTHKADASSQQLPTQFDRANVLEWLLEGDAAGEIARTRYAGQRQRAQSYPSTKTKQPFDYTMVPPATQTLTESEQNTLIEQVVSNFQTDTDRRLSLPIVTSPVLSIELPLVGVVETAASYAPNTPRRSAQGSH